MSSGGPEKHSFGHWTSCLHVRTLTCPACLNCNKVLNPTPEIATHVDSKGGLLPFLASSRLGWGACRRNISGAFTCVTKAIARKVRNVHCYANLRHRRRCGESATAR
ncbi:hypothetical protein J6590_019650 [Homalodisca vitripennis]|nr:hypothetical protein J6590_019650 [Homalodisca vitripennis]